MELQNHHFPSAVQQSTSLACRTLAKPARVELLLDTTSVVLILCEKLGSRNLTGIRILAHSLIDMCKASSTHTDANEDLSIARNLLAGYTVPGVSMDMICAVKV